ncbi:MAG: indolepyruvate oxidoreductase subunit beta [bacterium]|nr:indolepyruvate oxidoreductase subunit beta [bacterium]
MNENPITNVLVVGVGGQGVILASNILCEVALRAGFDTKKSEVHGMSQRGGSVTSHVRFGEKVFSPLIPSGQADSLLAFEAAEALRYCHEVKDGGYLIVSTQKIIPPIASGRRGLKYPENPIEECKKVCAGHVIPIDAEKIALELGNPRLTNTILLGALSKNLKIDETVWRDTIAQMVPKKTIEVNLVAFERGRNSEIK